MWSCYLGPRLPPPPSLLLNSIRCRLVVIDRGSEQKSRAQLFDHRGEFVRRIQLSEFSGFFDLFFQRCFFERWWNYPEFYIHITLRKFFKRLPSRLVNAMTKGGVDVQAACSTLAGHLVLVDHGGVVYSLDIDHTVPRIVAWFDTQPRLGEVRSLSRNYKENKFEKRKIY